MERGRVSRTDGGYRPPLQVSLTQFVRRQTGHAERAKAQGGVTFREATAIRVG